jgi:Gpi18-like mannosyltransferase
MVVLCSLEVLGGLLVMSFVLHLLFLVVPVMMSILTLFYLNTKYTTHDFEKKPEKE